MIIFMSGQFELMIGQTQEYLVTSSVLSIMTSLYLLSLHRSLVKRGNATLVSVGVSNSQVFSMLCSLDFI